MLKVFVVYGGHSDMAWMKPLGITETSKIDEADIVLFTGGADIDPAFYGEKAGGRTYSSSDRNILEKNYIEKAIADGKMLVGQCRGGQLICAFAGGKLIQDVTGHGGTHHKVTCADGDTYSMNSIHHQMQFPYTLPADQYEILSWTKGISKHYHNGNDEDIELPEDFVEVEAAHYKNIRGLAFQGHPEWMTEGSYGRDKCRVFLKNFIEETLQIELPAIPESKEKEPLELNEHFY